MRLYDLAHPLSAETPTYPGDPPVEAEEWATHDADGYRVTRLRLGSHAGTHVDAPAHTEPDSDGVAGDAHTVDEFPVDRFRFRARLVDLTRLGARDPITRADLPAAPDSSVDALVLHTGWGRHWGTDRYRDHPYLAADAADHLADGDLAVGLDTFGPDPTPSPNADEDEPTGVPAHHALLGAGLPVVENLRLAALAAAVGPGGEFRLHAYPLRVVGGDGSPVRAVAETGRPDGERP